MAVTKVTLRQKEISGNRQSLYLDFYPPIPHPETGKPTRREFLGMYIYPNAKTPTDKNVNKETIQLANNIRAARQLDLQKGYYGFLSDKLNNVDFVEYFNTLTKKRKGSNNDNWVSAGHYLNAFTGGKLRFADINETWCEDFKNYLLNAPSRKSNKVTLSTNSAVSYFNKVKATMKQAFKDGILRTDLNAKVIPIKQAETHRHYLTESELKALAKTVCPLPHIYRQASLFSALTGLRFSDILKMVWGEVQETDNDYQIQYKQQKTGNAEMLQISKHAFEMLGERQKPMDKVFEGLQYSSNNNKLLVEWVKAAGIEKQFTFHGFRHTYATIQLSKGTDIYTVSKLLGHKDIPTTQIYAKVINQTKRDAADKMNFDF